MRALFGFVTRYVFALLSSIWLFTLGWLWLRNRQLIARIGEHFGLRSASEPLLLPRVPAGEVVAQNGPVRLLEPEAQDGNVTLYELLVLSQAVAARRPASMLELGTFDGRTTLNLAANAPENARVYTLDLPASDEAALRVERADRAYIEKPASGARFQGKPEAARIQQLYGDSAKFDFSGHAGKHQLVFVDAAHSYEYVLNDSRIALRTLAPEGGVIFWHDYGVWEGVTRALNELSRKDPAFSGLRHIADTSLAVMEVGRR